MSSHTREQNQSADAQKPKIMTGFIHYNKEDDLAQLFDILNEFRRNNGLKYSHQNNVSMVFFNVSSEHLESLAKVRPFKISKYQTCSEYECDKETADKLMSQKDSFVKMSWDETSNTLTFKSRTISRVHGNLVRRIFKDSKQDFEKNNYQVIRDRNELQDELNTNSDQKVKRVYKSFKDQHQVRDQEDQDQDQEEEVEVKAQVQVQAQDQEDDQEEEVPDGFTKVNNNKRSKKPANSKIVKVADSSKPKVRGTKAQKNP